MSHDTETKMQISETEIRNNWAIENSKVKSELDQERARNEKDIADLKRKIEEVDGQNAQVSQNFEPS